MHCTALALALQWHLHCCGTCSPTKRVAEAAIATALTDETVLIQVVEENQDGMADPVILENHLRKLKHAPMLLGSFSAGSNVTGITPDLRALSKIMHKYGGIAAFDYASAAACGRVQVHVCLGTILVPLWPAMLHWVIISLRDDLRHAFFN